MRGRVTVFQLLRDETNPAADDALGAALASAAPGTSEAIVETLLARNRPDGLYLLIRQFHQLTGSARQRVVDDAERISRVLREALEAKDDRIRLNVMEIIRDARLYRAAYLLEAGLHDRQPRVRELAADALHRMTAALLTAEAEASAAIVTEPPDAPEEVTGERQRVSMSDLAARREDRRQLAAALGMGVARFSTHLQPKVVEAAMWLIDDLGSRFWTPATAPSSRVLRVATGILEQSASPWLVPFAYEGLTRSEIRPYVLRLLAERADAEFLHEWLRQGWRMAEPRIARTMAAIKELACAQDRAAALLDLPPDAERHVSRWIRMTGLPAETRALVLKELYRRGGSALRRTTVWSLGQCGDPRCLTLLRAVASERELECSTLARLELARRFPGEFPPSQLLDESTASAAPRREPHESPPVMTLDRYWNEFDTLTPGEQAHYGARLIESSPRAWALLNRHLSNSDAEHRVRALKIVNTLNLASRFANQIYPLSYDPHPEVRSAAVAALGQIPGATSRRIVQQALADPDQRVQANAVEAAEEGGHLAPDALLPKLASRDNRVRANAVKALLKLGVREAAETLLKMLSDSDRRQRVSALWLIEKMGLVALSGRVMQMAVADQDLDVRARAAALRAILLADESRPPEPAEVES